MSPDIKLAIAVATLLAAGVLFLLIFGSFMTESTSVASLQIEEHDLLIRGVIVNTVSDPFYVRAYSNGSLFFQCRGAEKIAFSYTSDTLRIQSDCNYTFEYDRLQKRAVGNVAVVYEPMKH